MKKKLCAGLLIALSLNANAYVTFGAPDCGKWIKEPSAQKKAWLLGFLSGLNAMQTKGSSTPGPLDKLNSADQAFVWMDNYCQRNPLKDVSDAGTDLFFELLLK